MNTWSVDGFVSEGSQPAELGWGSHERNFPRDGQRYDFGSWRGDLPDAARRRDARAQPGRRRAGRFHGFLITHGEAISIADYLTVREREQVVYRPTVHYAYHPCDAAVLSVHEFAGRNYQLQDRKRILMDDIAEGIDELGVLLAGHKRNAYWFGSQLSVEEARKLAPHNNATSLQVTVAVLSGMVWAIENPNGAGRARRHGFPPPGDLLPYLGPWSGVHRLDAADRSRAAVPRGRRQERSWQFKNVRVS